MKTTDRKRNILITCPPMIGCLQFFRDEFERLDWSVVAPNVVQTMSEEELVELVPAFDGWIIGDDPVTERVLSAGMAGDLKAAVKWGIGTDNIDKHACDRLGLAIPNTPNMFGAEVADIAMCYVIGLARELFLIDREVRSGSWPKPAGVSLKGKTAALIGYGDIGRNTASRLLASGMEVLAYDPNASPADALAGVTLARWPERLSEADFVVITCALNEATHHLINANSLRAMRDGVCIVNVSRGPIIDETALVAAQESGKVRSVALDVFENEPLNRASQLLKYESNIFGSHNASNTIDAVRRTSSLACEKLSDLLKVPQ
jgi:D-3-phosphoglycerate dehydrogenase / 2-oxoglutarate reductase